MKIKKKALNFSGRKDSKELYNTNLLFSVLYIIKNKWENNWISNGINIQDISAYNEYYFNHSLFIMLKKLILIYLNIQLIFI